MQTLTCFFFDLQNIRVVGRIHMDTSSIHFYIIGLKCTMHLLFEEKLHKNDAIFVKSLNKFDRCLGGACPISSKKISLKKRYKTNTIEKIESQVSVEYSSVR